MKVYVGDITKIDGVDVIVNSADTDFTPGGGIARWIAKEGGKEIFKEAQQYAAEGKVGRLYPTNAGELQAKRVYHIPTVNWETDEKLKMAQVHTSVVVALEKALEEGLSSVVFPLLGSGTLKMDESEVAHEIVEGIVHMEEENKGLEGSLCVLQKSVYETIKGVLPDEVEVVEVGS
jgi:O-acetyl-ADP-ribose deacetylase (regulator of RNase III)